MHVRFDLDGTLTDSRTGIARCIQHALVELGVKCPAEEALTEYVGPALTIAFAALLETSDPVRIDQAIAVFRQRFERIGMFENALYPGVAEAVSDLTEMGFRICVVTAKPHVYATRILEHFGLSGRFSGVYGPELADRTYSKRGVDSTGVCGGAGGPSRKRHGRGPRRGRSWRKGQRAANGGRVVGLWKSN
jgi:phosphoglycolate phosphatase